MRPSNLLGISASLLYSYAVLSQLAHFTARRLLTNLRSALPPHSAAQRIPRQRGGGGGETADKWPAFRSEREREAPHYPFRRGLRVRVPGPACLAAAFLWRVGGLPACLPSRPRRPPAMRALGVPAFSGSNVPPSPPPFMQRTPQWRR